MNCLNSIIIEGTVSSESSFTSVSDIAQIIFPVSVDRFYRNSKGEMTTETSVFEIKAFGRMAEICQKEASRGRGVRVVGRLSQELWTDEDDRKHSKVFIVTEHVEFKMKK